MTQQNQSPAETLRKARALLAEDKWCKGASALDKDGFDCFPDSSDAVARCALGAVLADEGSPRAPLVAAIKLLGRAAPEAPPNTDKAACFNDHPDTTLADVLALYDRAIALAEKEAEE